VERTDVVWLLFECRTNAENSALQFLHLPRGGLIPVGSCVLQNKFRYHNFCKHAKVTCSVPPASSAFLIEARRTKEIQRTQVKAKVIIVPIRHSKRNVLFVYQFLYDALFGMNLVRRTDECLGILYMN
jgi:hypothetical protein